MNKRLAVFAVIFTTLFSGCATSHIMKDCVQADDGKYICKNLKPWE